MKVILGNTPQSRRSQRRSSFAGVSANDTGARRLIEMMTEFKLTSLDKLAEAHPDAI